MSDSEQRIYVACLAAYNNGYLHGKWIDLPADDLWDQVNDMLEQSPIPLAEEWAIHDYEGFVNLSEYEDLDELNTLATSMKEHGADAVNAYIAIFGQWDEEKFEEAYHGDHSNAMNPELDYSTELFDELYAHQIPESLRFYIDYESFARDLFMSDYSSHNGHIFNCTL